MIFNTAKVMSKGQITLPAEIRKSMGLTTGTRLAVIYDNGRLMLMNPMQYAFDEFHRGMEGEWEKGGIKSEEDWLRSMKAMRKERRAE